MSVTSCGYITSFLYGIVFTHNASQRKKKYHTVVLLETDIFALSPSSPCSSQRSVIVILITQKPARSPSLRK